MEPFKRRTEEVYDLGRHTFGRIESVGVQATYIKTTYPSVSEEELHLFANFLPRDIQVGEGFPLYVKLKIRQGQTIRREINGGQQTFPDFSQWDSGLVEKIKDLPEHVLKIIDLK